MDYVTGPAFHIPFDKTSGKGSSGLLSGPAVDRILTITNGTRTRNQPRLAGGIFFTLRFYVSGFTVIIG